MRESMGGIDRPPLKEPIGYVKEGTTNHEDHCFNLPPVNQETDSLFF
jgi:hypothetical protein